MQQNLDKLATHISSKKQQQINLILNQITYTAVAQKTSQCDVSFEHTSICTVVSKMYINRTKLFFSETGK